MERIISYDELPSSNGQSIYLRMETDPRLYISLLSKGYSLVSKTIDADSSTIYVTGRRQDSECICSEEYQKQLDSKVEELLSMRGITKPKTTSFSYLDLIDYKYQLPFVLKNENQNGGREKFLIATEEDYENLINACNVLVNKNILMSRTTSEDLKRKIDYRKYLDVNFTVQDYIKTPSEFNTTVRVLTSSSNDLLYASLKYNEPGKISDDTTLLGYLLSDVFPLSTKTIVSNTLSGGENILLGEPHYCDFDRRLLDSHNIDSDQFNGLLNASKDTHEELKRELGIICGFDYIYDQDSSKWHLLEYHSRPMVGDYSKRQGIDYQTKNDRLTAEGRVRATALSLTLKKTR